MSTGQTLTLPAGDTSQQVKDGSMRTDVLPGTRYRLESLLGDGGAGEVYRGTHLELDKPVAIKVLREELSSNTDYSERFRREAKAASRIDHPGVVQVTDFGAAADGRLFLVMELIEGHTLAELVHEGPVPPARALRIMASMCEVLVAVHEAGVVHRDVKPANVFVLGDHDIKLVDFGIARAGLLGGADWRITRTGRVCGTPGYMAPEHARNKEIDGRADLYSCGAVLYELLTGFPPYQGDSPVDVLMAQMNTKLVPPSKVARGSGIPRSVDRYVARMLSQKADDRPESALVVAEQLGALADEIDPPAEGAEGAAPRKPPARRGIWLVAAGLGAVGLAVGGGAMVGLVGAGRGTDEGAPATLAAPPAEEAPAEKQPEPSVAAATAAAGPLALAAPAATEPSPPEEAPSPGEPIAPDSPASEPAAVEGSSSGRDGAPPIRGPAEPRREARPAPRETSEPPAPAETEPSAPSPGQVLRDARVAAVSGRHAEAERLYRQALAAGADRGTALSGLGRLQLARGQHAEAARTLQRAVAIRPGSAPLRVELGRAFMGAGHRNEAIAQWRAALRHQPGHERAERLLRAAGVEP